MICRICLMSLCAVALAQETATKPTFTARELFYNAQASTAAAPKAAAAPHHAKHNTEIAKTTKPAPKPTSPETPQQAPPTTVAANAPERLPGGAQIIRASATSSQPLGMKYSILESSDGSNEMHEVAPDTVFHSGDHIRFNVQSNSDGYLYILARGSSGTWQVLFPSEAVGGGSNRVQGFQSYTMPPGHQFTFDEQAGAEKVFLILSREPVPDLENLMYSLKNGKAAPVNEPSAPKASSPKQLVASLSIDDSMVGRLRETYSRDLIIEKVDANTPGDRKEEAVYVVNPKGSPDSHVVADLLLVHQ
jgi:hypothetical protein